MLDQINNLPICDFVKFSCAKIYYLLLTLHKNFSNLIFNRFKGMQYLGVAKKENGLIVLPDQLQKQEVNKYFEAFEIDGHILLLHPPVSRKRQRHIRELTAQAICKHKNIFKQIRD